MEHHGKPGQDMNEQQLGISEARFRTFADHVQDAYYLHDENWAVLDVNRRACEMLGYSREELIGMTPQDFDAFVLDHSKESIRSKLAESTEVRFDTYHRRKDGSTFPVEVRIFPHLERGRKLYYALVSDISDRMHTEETMMRVNRELRAITKCHHTLLRAQDEKTLLDDVCRIICDDAGYRMAWVGFLEHDEKKSVHPVASAGYDAGYVANSNISWSGDTDRGLGPVGQVGRSGNIVQIQDIAHDPRFAPWRDSALERGYGSSTSIPLKKAITGEVFGILSIYASKPDAFVPEEIRLLGELADDMAFGIEVLRTREERDQAEESLRQSEEQYRTIFMNSPLGKFRSTVDGQYIEINPALAEILGYASPEDMLHEVTNIGRQVYADPEMRKKVVDEQLQAPGSVNQYTNRYLRRDGTERVANLYLKTIRDAEGNPVFFDGIVEDITDRLQAEKMQQRLETQLVQAQKMEAIGQLTGGIAHDFNNMLGVILGFTDLLKKLRLEESSNEKFKKYTDAIKTTGDRAKELISQMLIFSRLSFNQNDEATNLLIEPVLKEVTLLLRSSVPTTIDLKLDIDDRSLVVKFQSVHLHQILLNLVLNAKHAITGHGYIRISAQKKQVDTICSSCRKSFKATYVEIKVEDNGSGIPKAIITHIFEPFFTTKGKSEGTGMGLSVIHGLVHTANGHIVVESEKDQGTSISILLPAVEENEHNLDTSSEKLKKGIEENILDGIHILLVDDEKVLLEMMQEILTMRGAEVSAFADATRALEEFKQHPGKFDIVITDETMPELNGLALSKAIMSLDFEIPIILCTGYSDNLNRDIALKQGIAGFMTKPADIDELLGLIRTLVSKNNNSVQ